MISKTEKFKEKKTEIEKIYCADGEIRAAKLRGSKVMADARAAIERDARFRKVNGLEQNQQARERAVADVRTHAPLRNIAAWKIA